ncbi:MAG: hypothetical protein O3B74_12020 [Proteobacteria bacterium]|nr:hypothetical protein [Pseudomonadota bacterium]MDA1308313.1 hypothetical protein [Pseudomonadota bacterium]
MTADRLDLLLRLDEIAAAGVCWPGNDRLNVANHLRDICSSARRGVVIGRRQPSGEPGVLRLASGFCTLRCCILRRAAGRSSRCGV